MAGGLSIGDAVQTPFGKGTVRELRNNGRVVVEIRGRAMVVRETEISRAEIGKGKRDRNAGAGHTSGETTQLDTPSSPARVASDIDLHGLTVDEALARAEDVLNAALLANVPELRFIHGRSGGRIRGALHRWLRSISAVSAFRIDPRNAGVTIVEL